MGSRFTLLFGAALTAVTLSLGLYSADRVDHLLTNQAQVVAGQGVVAPVHGRASAGGAGVLGRWSVVRHE